MHLPSIQAPCVHQNPDDCQGITDQYTCLGFEAMGCRFELLIDPGSSGLGHCDSLGIAEEMRALVQDWHQRLSIFEAGSIASQINRTMAGAEFHLDDDMYRLCTLCEQIRCKTNGAFNIAAGTLMHAHGFRSSQADHDASLDGLDLNHAFTLDSQNQSITKTDDRVMLDFGAIAKGFALDLIRIELEEHGVYNAFIHGGTSSILALGKDHRGYPWPTRVGADYTINLPSLAVGVSENLSQSVRHSEQRFGHVMNPLKNRPAMNSITQVVCIHPSAAAADAYSTACCASPALIAQLYSDPCTLIAFDSSPNPVIHDPLGVVLASSKTPS